MGQHVTRKRTNPTRQVPRHVLLKYSAHNVWSPVQHHFFSFVADMTSLANIWNQDAVLQSIGREVTVESSQRKSRLPRVEGVTAAGSCHSRTWASATALTTLPLPARRFELADFPHQALFRDQVRQSVRAVIDMGPT